MAAFERKDELTRNYIFCWAGVHVILNKSAQTPGLRSLSLSQSSVYLSMSILLLSPSLFLSRSFPPFFFPLPLSHRRTPDVSLTRQGREKALPWRCSTNACCITGSIDEQRRECRHPWVTQASSVIHGSLGKGMFISKTFMGRYVG